ncbi:MAG: carbohydrate binding domain-containing protein [Flavobacteriales bacterium]|nr:carbohydrate binding domain-containing protein [Flavobacteriales bacterium]
MKKTLLLLVVAMATAAQAQVVQSGFEAWTGNLPDGWFGSKSNIAQSAVAQVSTDVHGGTYAVQLSNGTPHKRFTSQPVTVAAGTVYSINFWVRGNGQVRTSLFDGRTDAFGYAPYNAYVTATSTWTEVTQTVAAAVDTNAAEFIFSVLSTGAPDHIVIDDVTITQGGTIPDASIYDIQFTTIPNGDSPLNGQTVNTGGIVTASYADAYYIQSGSDAWRGVYVFDNFSLPAVGDSVTMTASVSEFNNLTELTGITNFNVVSSGNPVPAPLNITTQEANEEALEGVLVRVTNATCTEEPGGANFGKWKADDGSGFAWIGKEIYTTTPAPLLGQVYDVTGVVSYSFALYGIQPRDANDITLITGVEENILSGTSVFPKPAQDVLNVVLPLGGVRYQLQDATGRIVREGSFSGMRAQLELSGVRDGMYTLLLMTSDAKRVERVSVQR